MSDRNSLLCPALRAQVDDWEELIGPLEPWRHESEIQKGLSHASRTESEGSHHKICEKPKIKKKRTMEDSMCT